MQVTRKDVSRQGCVPGTLSWPGVLRKLHPLTVCGLAASSLSFLEISAASISSWQLTTACLPARSQISFTDSLIWNRSPKTSLLAFPLFFLGVKVIPQPSHTLWSPIVLYERVDVRWTSNGQYSPLCQKWSSRHSCLWKLIRFPFLTGYSLTESENWVDQQGGDERKILGASVQERACEKMEEFRLKGSFLSKLLHGTPLGDVK